MIDIYSPDYSERLQYSLDVIFKIILQVDYRLLPKNAFNESTHPKINYSTEDLQADIQIIPHTLLFENTIKTQDIQVTYLQDIPYFFRTSDLSDIKFDVFASSFYMLSRYEEYLPFTADKYGRFTGVQSLAYKTGFLDKPVVHMWAESLKNILQIKHRSLFQSKRIFSQINSIDIDVAYACKGKPLFRRIGSFIKKIYHFYYKATWQRLDCKQDDPYDTYDYMESVQKKSGVETIYFFQVGKYGKYDKNLPLNNVMKQLIRRVSVYATIGIHPSFNTTNDLQSLQKESRALSTVLAAKITKSRQHYLNLQFPETYENLIKAGIQEDYTLGFADQIGFRAGMALPFPFFNLLTNKQRPLLLFPFQIMDGTLKDYLQLSPQEAIEKSQLIKKIIARYNGQMISIFHNSSLNNKGDWQGWQSVYEELLRDV